MSKFRALAVLLALAAWSAGAGLRAAEPADIDADRYIEAIKYLSSSEMRGRGSGSPELDEAAAYIADQFESLGLTPPDGSKTAYQDFNITIDAELGSGNKFLVESGGKEDELELFREFTPIVSSARGKAKGNLEFAGYGISAPEYGYDDYAGIDVRDKIVLVLNHEPQEHDRDSVFAGKVYTEHAQMYAKAINARLHGARAVVMVNDSEQHGGLFGNLTDFSRLPHPANSGIPFVQVSVPVVRDWFEAAGLDFDKVQKKINKQLEPHSFAFPADLRISLRTDLHGRSHPVHNVVAYLPGRTDEYVIVGAHYDHLGLGEQFSMRPSSAGTIHPGADDNASGTAGLLELARWFSSRPPMRRGVLFLAFGAEELGLLGSSYYVRDPLLPLSDAVTMINLDMIGRIRDNKVYVGGVRTGTTLRGILEREDAASPLTFDLSETAAYGSSDHTAFTTKEVPVLFFFSGLHGDYHRPEDTWDKITASSTAGLLRSVAHVVTDLAEADKRPEFVVLPAGPGSGAVRIRDPR